MEPGLVKGLSWATLAFGVLLYLLSVAGLFTAGAVPPGDPGLLATSLVFVLMGLAGVYLVRVTPTA